MKIQKIKVPSSEPKNRWYALCLGLLRWFNLALTPWYPLFNVIQSTSNGIFALAPSYRIVSSSSVHLWYDDKTGIKQENTEMRIKQEK